MFPAKIFRCSSTDMTRTTKEESAIQISAMKYCPRALKRFDISYIQRYNLNTYININ
jgi:hypothetical protein